MSSFAAARVQRTARSAAAVAAVVVGAAALSACATSATVGSAGANSGDSARTVQVVAAENFWGSIAAQIGGAHARVVSIITNPNTDPHQYEPTAVDARNLAAAQLVLSNGIGYDPWVPKLLAADGTDPTRIDVGDLLHIAAGGNPHRWYNPTDVQTVVDRLVADFQKLDPADSGYFAAQRTAFDNVALAPYHRAIAEIRARYAGVPVGASESIFSMIAPALGLNLVTPYSFLRAVSEGSDVSAADKTTIDNQIKNRLIKIYVYNSQNATPDVQAQLAECKTAGIPTATITETMQPSNTSYQAWQTGQLLGIQAALHKAVDQALDR